MKIIYSGESAPGSYSKSIFLAGPTPRSRAVKSWRPKALKILEKLGYDGVVFVPEWRDPSKKHFDDYEGQIDWEHKYLDSADAIVFWVPRNLKTLPGFTTNVEFGLYANSGRIIFGAPSGAPKISYLNSLADRFCIPRCSTLESTFKKALEIIGSGALRSGGECFVPLIIWSTDSFQTWHSAQKKAGNRLDGAKVEWVNLVGKKNKFVFRWAMKADVFVADEKRNKSNESIVSRTNISSAMLIKPEKDLLKSKIILVREFRSPAATADGFVHELPSGSSPKLISPQENALQELEEETGFKINPARLQLLAERQLAGTFSAHKAHVYYAEITEEELKWFEEREGKLKINDPDPTGERLYIEIKTAEELLKNDHVDWSNLGMIFSALNAHRIS